MSHDFKQRLEELRRSGRVDSEMMDVINESFGDPNEMKRLYEILKDFGGAELEEPLNIEDFYHERDGALFGLRWPISPINPAAAMFDQLDRKTQFFVLFTEWQRRETEGMMALTSGRLDDAERIFDECLARAQQIEVGELIARSYEGLMRLAQRRSDREAERRWSQKALEARAVS
jgi:hypothetical protein